MMQMYEAMEDWAEIRALRHEDCSCEGCLNRLEEAYDEMVEMRAEDFKRPEILVDWDEMEQRLGLPNKYPWGEYEDLALDFGTTYSCPSDIGEGC